MRPHEADERERRLVRRHWLGLGLGLGLELRLVKLVQLFCTMEFVPEVKREARV